jgi:uncharacterized membrane protein
MAGIGFELRRLGRQESLSSLVAAFGHAAVVAAGPWIITILSLAAITLSMEPVIGRDVLATFRAVVIYAFALSLVLAAPVTIVATRLVADALWLRRPADVRPLLFGAYVLAIASVAPGVLALVVYFELSARLALAQASMSLVVALIWVSLSFCGAVRDYLGVTLSFLFGLVVGVVSTIGAALAGGDAAAMAVGFTSGLGVTFLGLSSRVLTTFPEPMARPEAGVLAILGGLVRYRELALGALLGTAGVWVDKWLFWLSEAGQRVSGGLLHAPIYDSAMFIASLVIVPSLAAFVVRLETGFFERYQRYYGTIRTHGTLEQIEAARVRLAGYTLDNFVLITVTQVGIAAVLILMGPLIIDALSLQFSQIAILRFGALGAVFHFILIAAISMLVFFDRRRLFLVLSAGFLVLNAVLTLVSIRLGEDYFGVGYFLATLVTSFLAYHLAVRTFEDLNYLTFIGNNPSIRDAAEDRDRRRRRGELAAATPGRG